MNFSLWNFTDWFDQKGISYSYHISDTINCIENVKFADSKHNAETTCYALISACAKKDTNRNFYRSKLSFHKDEILFPVASIDQIMNLSMDMIESFNQWENNLADQITSGATISSLFSNLQIKFPYPMAVIYENGSQTYSSDDWDFSDINELLNQAKVYTSKNENHYSPVFLPWNKTPEDSFILKKIQINLQTNAFIFAYDANRCLKAGDLHIFNTLCDSIKQCLVFQFQHSSVAHPLNEWYAGQLTDDSHLSHTNTQVLYNLGWKPEDYYQILSIFPSSSADINLYQLISEFDTYHHCCIPTSDGISVLMHYQEDYLSINDYEINYFVSHCTHKKVRIGLSIVFRDIKKAAFYYKQTLFCMSYSPCKQQKIIYMDQLLASELLHSCQQITGLESYMHPSVRKLAEADLKGNDSLLQTLYTFLIYGQSTSHTAEQLCIHRNSLRLRLMKIQEIVSYPTMHNDELMHLLLSLIIAGNFTNTKLY